MAASSNGGTVIFKRAEGGSVEDVRPGHEEVRGRRERVDVAGRADRRGREDRLGRHVERGPGDLPGAAEPFAVAGQILDQAEIQHLHPVPGPGPADDEHVRWLDVAVHHPERVRLLERGARLGDQVNDATGRQRPRARDELV
jgi:hypothetical protein